MSIGMDVALASDEIARARKTLQKINAAGEFDSPFRLDDDLDSEIAQRLVDNSILLLEAAKLYQKLLKAHRRKQRQQMRKAAAAEYRRLYP